MEDGSAVLIAIAVAAGAFVQGLSGLGFALVAAPVVTQLVPGTGGVGLVNVLSIVQNAWLIARTDGAIAWRVLRSMLPGLVLGVLLGWALLRMADPRLYDVLVAVSACGSVVWLVSAERFRGRLAAALSAVWGALVNTVAGVGGPPLAAYLVTRGLPVESYVRTLQVLFAALSLASLPLLGVSVTSPWSLAAWVVALIAGSAGGEALRRRLAVATAQRVARIAIIAVCVIALARSVVLLVAG